MAEENKEKSSRAAWRCVYIVCLAAAAVVLALLVFRLVPRHGEVVSSSSAPEVTESEAPLAKNPIDFASLQAESPDVCGWIRIPGTVVDYPVLQSGEEQKENFYLNHAPDGKYRYAGSIYMQKMNAPSFSDPNTVLYGHNMANGTMFSALKKFRNKDFFDSNSEIYIYTPGHILTYRIYSAFVYDNRHILNSFNFYDPPQFASFIEETLHPVSMVRQVREGVSVTTDDRILTLSTCTNRDTERYLVEGVLLDDQPTE